MSILVKNPSDRQHELSDAVTGRRRIMSDCIPAKLDLFNNNVIDFSKSK